MGSIGVVYAGFGFNEFIARHGVQRRLYTAGERKGALDPFLPENRDDVVRLRTVQSGIHEAFIEMVRERRGEKLKAPDDELFNGDFWIGAQALDLGLIDGIGELRATMRARYGKRVRFRSFTPARGWLQARLGMHGAPMSPPRAAADGLVDAVVDRLEERALWSRFGL